MKFFAVFALFVAAAVAGPLLTTNNGEAQIPRYDPDNTDIDGYSYAFETSNGIIANEQGALKNLGSDNVALEIRGVFSYICNDGNICTVTYTANERGF